MSDRRDTSRTTNGETERGDHPGEPVEEVTLVARMQEHDDRPDTCTIHPVDVDDWTAITTWISADDGSFVPLDDRR